MFVSCHMPKKVRVGRSASFFILKNYAKKDFVGKIGGKFGYQNK